jgi:hypothetical protein
MQASRWVASLAAVAVAAGIAFATPASAKRITCADIEAGLTEGKSLSQVRDELATNDARVEVCARIWDQRQRNEARHDSARAARAERRQRVD